MRLPIQSRHRVIRVRSADRTEGQVDNRGSSRAAQASVLFEMTTKIHIAIKIKNTQTTQTISVMQLQSFSRRQHQFAVPSSAYQMGTETEHPTATPTAPSSSKDRFDPTCTSSPLPSTDNPDYGEQCKPKQHAMQFSSLLAAGPYFEDRLPLGAVRGVANQQVASPITITDNRLTNRHLESMLCLEQQFFL